MSDKKLDLQHRDVKVKSDQHEVDDILEPSSSYLEMDKIMTDYNPGSYLKNYRDVDPEHVIRKLTFLEKLRHLFR